jgi:hypothetical protein
MGVASGFGLGGPGVGGSFSGAAAKGPILLAAPGEPLFAKRVAPKEVFVSCRGQTIDRLFILKLLRTLRLLFTLGMIVFLEELLQMGFDEPPRGQGVHGGVGLHLGRVEEQLLASEEPGLDAHLDDPLEEVSEESSKN